MDNHNLKIGIIVVLFNKKNLNIDYSLLSNEAFLIVIDNTPNQVLNFNDDNIKYIPMLKNIGIAEAQNYGIQIAKKAECSHVIFFDQDSIIPDGFIDKMVKEYDRISKKYDKLFLLGPTIFNGRDNNEYKSTIHKDNIDLDGFIHRREIISSGSCISMNRINEVGVLLSKLFIDYVDFEWCWRANSMGYISGITRNVTLNHFVGQREYRIFNQLVIISSPIRYFYQTRNFLWLIRFKYVPISWKINTFIKMLTFAWTYPFKTNNWESIYKNIINGIKSGIRLSK